MITAPSITAQFTVNSKALKKALSFVGGVIQSNPIVPILDNVLVDIADGVATLTGSDLNTSLSTSVDLASFDENIRFCIPYKTLSDLLSTLADQPVSFSLSSDTHRLAVTTQSDSFVLSGESPDDYPPIETDSDAEQSVSLSARERTAFVDKLSRLGFAASTDPLKPALCGVCLWRGELCATDAGMKLSRVQRAPVDSDKQIIIPVGVLNALVKLSGFAGDADGLKLSFTANHCLFTVGDYSILGTLLDDTYPAYQGVFPSEFAHTWMMEKGALLTALRRVMVLTQSPIDTIILEGDSVTGNLTLMSTDKGLNQQGNSTLYGEIAVSMRIAFVGKILLECVQNVAGNLVTMHLNDATKTVMLTGNDSDASVLMFPIRLTA